LHFDLWINANGPFPAGGTGSTQHGTGGIGTAGNRVQWAGTNATADGVWFGVDGEGQAVESAPDFRAYVGTTLQATNSGVYAAGIQPNSRMCNHSYYASAFPGGQTAPATQGQSGGLATGTIGFAWRDVIINKTGSKVDWFIDGLRIATVTNVSLAASNIFIGYWDSFNSLSDNTNLSFGMFDNVRVERLLTNVPPYITGQPQSQSVAQGSNAVFNVVAGGTAALGYQWRFSGTNIFGATQNNYTRPNAQLEDAGSYAVVVSNASGSVTSSVAALTVLLPPSITAHPDSQSVRAGSNAVFSVLATGSPPLAYQWQFNGADISGATDSSYTRPNVTLNDAGNYSVVVDNMAGETTSSNALLTVTLPAPWQFGSANVNGSQVELVLLGEPGTSATLWRSDDLTNWVIVTNLFNATGTVQFSDDLDLAVPQRFYRTVFP
jgi:hypothetical protein